jgi:hypothetical protein
VPAGSVIRTTRTAGRARRCACITTSSPRRTSPRAPTLGGQIVVGSLSCTSTPPIRPWRTVSWPKPTGIRPEPRVRGSRRSPRSRCKSRPGVHLQVPLKIVVSPVRVRDSPCPSGPANAHSSAGRASSPIERLRATSAGHYLFITFRGCFGALESGGRSHPAGPDLRREYAWRAWSNELRRTASWTQNYRAVRRRPEGIHRQVLSGGSTQLLGIRTSDV